MNENSMSKKLKWSSSVTQNCFSYKGFTWYIKQQLMALHDTLNNNNDVHCDLEKKTF